MEEINAGMTTPIYFVYMHHMCKHLKGFILPHSPHLAKAECVFPGYGW